MLSSEICSLSTPIRFGPRNNVSGFLGIEGLLTIGPCQRTLSLVEAVLNVQWAQMTVQRRNPGLRQLSHARFKASFRPLLSATRGTVQKQMAVTWI